MPLRHAYRIDLGQLLLIERMEDGEHAWWRLSGVTGQLTPDRSVPEAIRKGQPYLTDKRRLFAPFHHHSCRDPVAIEPDTDGPARTRVIRTGVARKGICRLASPLCVCGSLTGRRRAFATWVTHMPGNEAWLIGERRTSGEHKNYLSNLSAQTSIRVLASTIKARWICGQAHQQLRKSLGSITSKDDPGMGLNLTPS